MSTHTVFTTVSILMLSVAMCTGAVLWAVEEEVQIQNPVVVTEIDQEVDKDGGPSWNPAAAKLLALYDEHAVFKIAADADAVRALLLNTRPLKKIIHGDNMLLKNWQQEIARYQAWAQPTDAAFVMLGVLPVMRGAFVQTYVRLDHRIPVMTAMDMGDSFKGFMDEVLLSSRQNEKIGNYDMYRSDLGDDEYAVQGNRLMSLNVPASADEKYRQDFHARLKGNAAAPVDKNLQKNPLWMTINARPLLEAYLPLSAETQSPVEDFFGANWKNMHPRIDVSMSEHGGDLRVQGKWSDVHTAGPLLAALLFVKDTLNSDLRLSPVQLRAPQNLPAADATALAEIRLGCDIEKHAILRASLGELLQNFGLSRLMDSWNGELLLRVHAGIPMPQPTIVLGLRTNSDALKQDIAQALQAFGAQKQTAARDYTDAWTIFTPVGMLTCALAEDRLVISAAAVEKLLEKAPDDAGLSIDIDLPQIAQSYAPLLWGMIPQRSRFFELRNPSGQAHHLLISIHDQLRAQKKIEESGKLPQEIHSPIILEEGMWEWLGNHESVHSYASVWEIPLKDQKDNPSLQMVYYTQNAYLTLTSTPHPTDDRIYGYEGAIGPGIQTVKEMKDQLQDQGARHVAGVRIEELKAHPRGEVPIFDRQRLIPSLPNIIAALPRYTLRWHQGKNGEQHFEETGLPLMGVGMCAVAFAIANVDPIAEERKNNDVRMKAQAVATYTRAFTTYEKRLADLQRIVTSMKGQNWNRSSALLQHAPADALSALGLGEQPSAEQIDQHGRWYGAKMNYEAFIVTDPNMKDQPDERSYECVYWILPLEKDLWIYIGESVVWIKVLKEVRLASTQDEIDQLLQGFQDDDLPQQTTPDKIDNF